MYKDKTEHKPFPVNVVASLHLAVISVLNMKRVSDPRHVMDSVAQEAVRSSRLLGVSNGPTSVTIISNPLIHSVENLLLNPSYNSMSLMKLVIFEINGAHVLYNSNVRLGTCEVDKWFCHQVVASKSERQLAVLLDEHSTL